MSVGNAVSILQAHAVQFLVMVVLLGVYLLLRLSEGASLANWGGQWRNRLAGLNRRFCQAYHGLQHDTLNLPEHGGAVVVGNHVSGLDPMLMIAASPRPLRFLIAREEYDRWYLNWLFRLARCIPVERESNPRAAFYAARRAIENGEVVALFPQGRIVKPGESRIRLKRGAVALAKLTGVPLYALKIDGVRGQGLAATAALVPGKVRITTFQPIDPRITDEQEALKQLAQWFD
jgi:1-acyl-sn-glycerol-3-phosphate acyltransferase